MKITSLSAALSALALGLRTTIDALPIDAQDKRRINDTLDAIEKLTPSFGATTVKVQKSDVEAAVKTLLPAMVAAEIAKQKSETSGGAQ